MPAKLTVAAQTLPDQRFTKGDIVAIIPDEFGWGNKEVPPNFVRVRITDAEVDQVRNYLEGWNIKFAFEIKNQNPAGWRIWVQVDPLILDASQTVKNFLKAEMETVIAEEPFNGSVVNYTSSRMVVDIPKPDPIPTNFLQDLRDAFNDLFESQYKVRRYRFNSASVDNAAVQPLGFVEITEAQALANIEDRLTQ